MVERWARATARDVQFVYTLPTNATGLDQGGSYVLQNAVANGARIAIVNAMTFDYYDNLPHEMADNTEGAAQQLFDRLHRLFPRDSQRQLWGMIGVTEDLGVDDFGPAETFTLADARTVERWAASRGLAELSFWNVQDDNSAGSQLKQTPYEFSHILEPFTSSATRPAAAGAMAPAGTGRGATDPPGNPRSVSCPASSFCMAVDQFGHDAMRWNGRDWTAPVSIEPGGTRVELNAVSCPDSSFCVAVDTSGNALTWNGWSWSAPGPIDPHGAGLTAVSCPSAAFCATVDGHGNALTWSSGHWSRPVPVDRSGAGLQSVSCASASFCAAGDWNGNALTWNGRKWSAPVLVDLTGDGVESVSCASVVFCMAVDWNGNALSWNGASWSGTAISCPDSTTSSAGDCTTTGSFADPRAGVLDSVSCPSASFCAAVDVTGYALTWNGTSWSRPVWSATSPADPHGGALAAVSCASALFCVAVDGDGRALVWDGRGWSVPVAVDPDGGGLTAVSCPSAWSCVAVDFDGRVLALR